MLDRIRLTDRELRVLVAGTLRADASIKEIAKRAGVKEHSARYVIDSLLGREIITPVYLIDNYRLGYTDFGVFLTRGAESSKGRRDFEKRIEKIPQVYWLAKTIGDFQYGLTFLARRAFELDDLFSLIRPPDQAAYFEKLVGLRLDWTIFSPRHLAPELSESSEVVMSSRDELVEFDEVDHQILILLAKQPGAYPSVIARAAKMAPSVLQYRLDKLRKEKILRGQMYLVDLEKLGVLTYRILVVERSFSDTQKAQFRKFCANSPNATVFLSCTGAWDYEIRFEATTAELLDAFCREMFDSFGSGIGSIRIIQQSRVLKRYAYPGA